MAVSRRGLSAFLVLAMGPLASASQAQDGTGGRHPVLLSFAQGYRSLTGNTALLGSGLRASLVNPASLGLTERIGLGVDHSELFAGTSYNSLGSAWRLGRFGSVGLGYYQLRTEEAEKRNELGEQVGTFRNEESVVKLGFGRTIYYRFLAGLSIGGFFNYYRRQLDDASNGFYSIDAGVRYPMPFLRNMDVGLLVNNLVSSSFGGTEDTIPMVPRVGASYAILDGLFGVTADVEVGSPLHYSFGLSYIPMPMIAFNLANQPNVFGGGVSLRLKDYQFNYDLGMHELGKNHKIGLTLYFGKPDSALRRYLEQLYAEADKQAEAGSYLAALGLLRKAARHAPLPEREKKLREGLEKLKDANITAMRGDGEGADMIRRGIAFFLKGNDKMAAEIFKAALFKDSRNLMVQRLLAMAQGEKTDGKSAADLPTFTAVDPLQLKLTKAEQYFQDQMWDQALKELREVIEINPKEVGAYVRLGSVYYVMEMKDKAKASWEYAQTLDPSHPEVRTAVQFMKQEGI